MKLPKEYLNKIEKLLKNDYQKYLDSFNNDNYHGLRVNTLKISVEDFLKISPFELIRIPWIANGFYYDSNLYKPGTHIYYSLGLYYLQEPSAMTPACYLPIDKGDFVLDLCAAPGGKTTELASKLANTGMLISNDISNSRAKTLLKNIELAGIKNAIVMSEDSNKLIKYYDNYFDKILLDAPCSGEGMFRKDPKMVDSWLKNGPYYYNKIQVELIEHAYKMLKPGGLLMYSTCTFDTLENEEVINSLINKYDDIKAIPINQYQGFSHSDIIPEAIRIWPHLMNGEGHFLCLLKKDGDKITNANSSLGNIKLSDITNNFLKLLDNSYHDNLLLKNDYLYNMPKYLVNTDKLRLLRNGLLLGKLKNGRIEPSQALACALNKNDYKQTINLNTDDIRVNKYLKGETITINDLINKEAKGYVLVLVDNKALGFGKVENQVLKNKYASGWIR